MVTKIGLRRWMGEQEAAAAMDRKTFPRVYSFKRCRLVEPQKGVPDGGAWLFLRRTVSNPGSWIFLLTAPYIYHELTANDCKWSRHNDKGGAYRRWRTYPGHIRRIGVGFQ